MGVAETAHAGPHDRRDYPWNVRPRAAGEQGSDKRQRVLVERYTVDIGAYAGRAAAEARAGELREHFDDVRVETIEDDRRIRHRVTCGEFRKEGGAKARIKALGELGFAAGDMTVRKYTFEQITTATEVTLTPIMKQPHENKGDGRLNVKLFGRPLNIAGEYQFRPSYLNNFNLLSESIKNEDGNVIRRSNTDTFRLRNSARLEGLWLPHDNVAIFAQGRLNWNVRETARKARLEDIDVEGEVIPVRVGGCGDPPKYPRRCDSSEVQLVRGQTWIYIHDLWDVPAGLQVGRQRFRDKREWWWDANLDAVQLHTYGTDFLRFEATVAQEVAQLAPDEEDIEPEEDDVLRLLGHATWRWAPRHRLEGFVLYQHDGSGIANGEFNGIPGFGWVDPKDRDELDRDMVWFGARASGRWKVHDDHRLYYWADAAVAKGKEVEVDYGSCPDDDPNCECDLVPEGCAIRPPQNEVIRRDVQGWGVDVGVTWDTKWPLQPSFTFGYAVGSGDGDPDRDPVATPEGDLRLPGTDSAFRQTGLHDNNGKFRGVNRFHYYGELLRPELSNIHIGTLAVGFPLFESSSIEILWHIYEQVNEASFLLDSALGPSPNGRDRDLGQEIDVSIGIEEWDQLELELTAAVFRAGDAFSRTDPAQNRSGEIASYFEFRFDYNF